MMRNLPMKIASILLCSVLFTTYLVSGLYARYTTKSSSYDSARVITFGDLQIKEEGDYEVIDGKHQYIIIPGVNLKKNIEVSFTGSEAATYVFVEMKITGDWQPENENFKRFIMKDVYSDQVFVSFDIDDTNWTSLGVYNTNTYVYYKLLEPNETLDVGFIKTNGLITVSKDINELQVNNLQLSKIDVKGHVVQVGTFENATSAWNSLQ